MKTILLSSVMTLGAACLILPQMGCNEENELNVNVIPVKNLYEPQDGKVVTLAASGTLFFEWEPTKAEDGGMTLYEVLFDRADGDFSNPIYRLASDGNGAKPQVTVSHKTLNSIAAKAGIGSAQMGTLKWTAAASKGINAKTSDQRWTLTLTRLAGFADVPPEVYITGEGSEGGVALANAIALKSTTAGEFEIYTRLEANKNYHFVDKTSGTPRKFYKLGEVIAEGEGAATVEQTGIYKLSVDFTTGTFAISSAITKVGLWFCPDNNIIYELDYVGGGVWRKTDMEIHWKQEGWGRDERYHIRMYKDSEETCWGPTNRNLDSRPSGSDEYFNMTEYTDFDQWGPKWKFVGDADFETTGKKTTLEFSLTPEGYTHVVTCQ